MSKLRIALRVLGLTVIGVGLLILWAIHSFNRDFDKFITVTANDVSELGIAIRGAAGESLFTRGTFPPSRPKSGTAPDLVSQAKELLASYRRDPEKFKKYANLFDTVMNAIAVRDALLKIHPCSAPR